MAAFNKELRHSLHKVHLLCMVAHGLQLSRQCDCPLLQSVLLSLVPRELCLPKRDQVRQESLLKLLEWFTAETVPLQQNIEASCPDLCYSIVAQLLVALLRAVGLRARIVLVLDPISFKASGKKSLRKGVKEGMKKLYSSGEDINTSSRSTAGAVVVNVVKMNSGGNSNPLESTDIRSEENRDALTQESLSAGNEKRSTLRKRKALPVSTDAGVPTSSKKRRKSSISRGANSGNPDQEPETSTAGDTACTSKSAGRRRGKGKGRRESKIVSSAKSSPYFKKKGKSGKRRARQGDSESASDHFDSSDEDFVPKTKPSRIVNAEESQSESSDNEMKTRKAKSKNSKGKRSKNTMSLVKKIKSAADGANTSSGSVTVSPSNEERGEGDRSLQRRGAKEKEKESGEKLTNVGIKGALYGRNDRKTDYALVYIKFAFCT